MSVRQSVLGSRRPLNAFDRPKPWWTEPATLRGLLRDFHRVETILIRHCPTEDYQEAMDALQRLEWAATHSPKVVIE